MIPGKLLLPIRHKARLMPGFVICTIATNRSAIALQAGLQGNGSALFRPVLFARAHRIQFIFQRVYPVGIAGSDVGGDGDNA